ncbi:MAG: aspartate kinase [Pyrinomonadaceae bacterium]
MRKLERNIRVMKFGGTSVADADCIKRAANIVAAEVHRAPIVTVVSAMGGVTNRLIDAAYNASRSERNVSDVCDWLRNQHLIAVDELIKNPNSRATLVKEVTSLVRQVVDLYHGTSLLGELTPRALDSISSVGERLSAKLFAATLEELGVKSAPIEATELIITDSNHGQAEPLMDQTRERAVAHLLPLLAAGISPVVTGFIGASKEGRLTTLGRGGSDYSASILGAVLDAAEVIIWTDVDGVLSADPRLVSDARVLNEISYNEAAELAYFGAKVLHPKTLRPLTEAGIPIWIRNSSAPKRPGTKITSAGNPSTRGVKAITSISDVALITLGGRGIVGAPDVLAKVFAATASARANVLLVSQASSQNDICFVLHAADAEPVIAALREAFALELAQQKVEHITVDTQVAIVAVVGERMRGTLGVAGRTFSVLGCAGANVIAIAQGSSEYNISFVIEAGATQQAVAAIHEEFKLNYAATDVSSGDAVREIVTADQLSSAIGEV